MRKRIERCLLLMGCVMLLLVAARGTARAEKEETERQQAGRGLCLDAREREERLRDLTVQADEEAGEWKLCWQKEPLPFRQDGNVFYFPLTGTQQDEKIEPEEFSCREGEQVIFWDFPEKEELKAAAAEGREYPLTVISGGRYQDYVLVFTGMPVLEIRDTYEKDEDFDKIHVRLFQGKFGGGTVIDAAGKIKIRGALSKQFPKVGYRLRLVAEDGFGNQQKRPESLLEMRCSDAWDLIALYADDLKIRDKISIDLWEKLMEDRESYGFDAAFASRMEYVEVLRDGEYLGIYGLLEPIDARQLGISDAAGAAGKSEYYYKKQNDVTAPEEAFVFSEEEQVLPDTKTEDETENSVNYVASLEIKEAAGKLTAEAWEPIRQYMCMMRYGAFEEMAPALLDLDNVTDMWIYLQVIAGVDNDIKNMYYTAKLVDGTHRIYFIPWDMDMSWGNEYCEEAHTFQSYYTVPAGEWIEWNPASWMLSQGSCRLGERIAERLRELRQTIFSDEALYREMEEQFTYLKESGAYERDAMRWPQSPHTETLEPIREFTKQRMKALEEYAAQMKDS